MKKTLIAVAVILVVVVAGLFVAPAFIPVETYRGQIETAAREATGRALKIEGDISLSLLPRLAVEAEDVSFENAPGAAEPQMASIEKLAVQLQILPLLSREVKLDRLVLVRPSILLEVDAQGRPNWVFGTASAPAAAAESAPSTSEPAEAGAGDGGATLANVALGEVRLEGGRLAYKDARSGAAYEVDDVNMDVSLASLDSPLTAEGGLVWNGKTISLTLAADRPRALLENGTTSLSLKIESEPLQLGYDGSLDKGETLQMAAAVDLEVPSIRELAAWAGTPLKLDGDGLGPFSIKGKLSATPTRFAFTEAEIGLDGMAGQGALTADVSGAKPDIRGELKLDVLDANKYLPPEAAQGEAATEGGDSGGDGGADSAEKSASQEWSDAPIDLAGLQALNLAFDLSAQGIRIRKIEIGESALGVAIKDGLLTADLKQLKLYDGVGRAEVALDGRGATPSVRNNFTLTGVDAGRLLTDAADFDRLEGSGDIALAVTASGKSQKEMVQSLNGDGAIKFVDGAIRGINLAQMVRNVTTAFTDTGEAQKTDFAELSGTFQITRGLLRNDDLLLLNPLLRVTGAGTADLPGRTVDYRVEPKVVGSLEGQGGDALARGLAVPVIAEGPWHDITYRPDLAAAVGEIAKDPKEALKDVKETGKSLLKGLTGGGGETPEAGGAQEEAPNPADALKKLFGD
ncbi:MAG: AsmA family protein [Kiloniellales bacterium]|nr:AsmA family protein [Kiloniellales bacterium]